MNVQNKRIKIRFLILDSGKECVITQNKFRPQQESESDDDSNGEWSCDCTQGH